MFYKANNKIKMNYSNNFYRGVSIDFFCLLSTGVFILSNETRFAC